MVVDLVKLNKFVGMLGSEHAGEQSNAANFIKKMAEAQKMSLVEFFTAAYSSERIVYKTETVYQDRPGATRSPPPQSGPYRNPGADDFARQYARAYKRQQEEDQYNEEQKMASEMRKAREAAEDARMGRGKSRAYGHGGSMIAKIRSVLSFHTMALTKWEKEFLEDLIDKLTIGYEMTPKQRNSYAEIMKKVGY